MCIICHARNRERAVEIRIIRLNNSQMLADCDCKRSTCRNGENVGSSRQSGNSNLFCYVALKTAVVKKIPKAVTANEHIGAASCTLIDVTDDIIKPHATDASGPIGAI